MSTTDDAEQALPLDERIRRAEQRLIEREDALRVRVEHLRHRLHAATRPARLVWPGLGAVGGLAALLLALRRFRRRDASGPRPRLPPERRHHRPREAHDMPWVRLVAFAWPMLPERWRAHVNPGLATALATFGVPLFERLMSRRRAAAERRADREALRDQALHDQATRAAAG